MSLKVYAFTCGWLTVRPRSCSKRSQGVIGLTKVRPDGT